MLIDTRLDILVSTDDMGAGTVYDLCDRLLRRIAADEAIEEIMKGKP